MSSFERRFSKVLKEDDMDPTVGMGNAETDHETWKQSFDKPEDADQFKSDVPDKMGEPGVEHVATAEEWVSKMDEFLTWLNGTDGQSLNSQFRTLDKEGSVFEGLSKDAGKLVSIAGNVAQVIQSLKGKINGAKGPSKAETAPEEPTAEEPVADVAPEEAPAM